MSAERDALLGMVEQFACHGHDSKRRWLHTGGLSALEDAFAALGWDDPHYTEEGGCEIAGCMAFSTCVGAYPRSRAAHSDDPQRGFGFLCGEHFRRWNGRDSEEAPDLGRSSG